MKWLKKYNVYDDEVYQDFGKQPGTLEIRLGLGLVPLAHNFNSESKDIPVLFKEINYCRNQMDAEYGIPLPQVKIRDDLSLSLHEYSILLNGTVEKSEILNNPGIEDTAEALVISRTIGNQLVEIVKRNFSRILNQKMVNDLINKVTDKNPDVVDNLLLRCKEELTPFIKIILLQLLEEQISVRDMNTILETIADCKFSLFKNDEYFSDITDKVREKLSYQFFKNLADKENKINVIKLSGEDSLYIFDNECYGRPEDKTQRPSIDFLPDIEKRMISNLEQLFSVFNDKKKVIFCPYSYRNGLSNTLKRYFSDVYVISDSEAAEVFDKYKINVIGETSFAKI